MPPVDIIIHQSQQSGAGGDVSLLSVTICSGGEFVCPEEVSLLSLSRSPVTAHCSLMPGARSSGHGTSTTLPRSWVSDDWRQSVISGVETWDLGQCLFITCDQRVVTERGHETSPGSVSSAPGNVCSPPVSHVIICCHNPSPTVLVFKFCLTDQ